MRKIIAGAFMSLDGVMQAPGGPQEDPTGGFAYGGWVWPYWDDVTGAAMSEGFAQPFDLLLGRKTYDIFAAYWPYIETNPKALGYDEMSGGIATLFNKARKYVATRGNRDLTWQNSMSLGRDVVGRLRELKKEDGPTLLIQGSSNLVQTLITHDLIDEFRLLIFPLVFGKGKRLFGEGTLPVAFKLARSTTSSTGVLIATYDRAGEIKTGSFAPDKPSAAEIERRKYLT